MKAFLTISNLHWVTFLYHLAAWSEIYTIQSKNLCWKEECCTDQVKALVDYWSSCLLLPSTIFTRTLYSVTAGICNVSGAHQDPFIKVTVTKVPIVCGDWLQAPSIALLSQSVINLSFQNLMWCKKNINLSRDIEQPKGSFIMPFRQLPHNKLQWFIVRQLSILSAVS